MRVLIATAGSHGDVAPYTGLGARLQSAGHEVTVATHARSAELVRCCGLDFHPLPLDEYAGGPTGRSTSRGPQGGSDTGHLSAARQVRLARELAPRIAEAIAHACACGTELLLVSSGLAPLGLVVAEGLGLPSIGVFLQPLAATRQFPPPVFRMPSLGPLGNLAAGHCVQALLAHAFAPGVRHLRRQLSVTRRALRGRRARWPVYHGFSPAVVSQPADWRPGLEVAGYWWPEHPPGWKPEPRLVDFIQSGSPPVFVGFGSMALGPPEALARCVARALKLARVRGVVQAGWAGLVAQGADIMTIGPVPHDWLFPKMAAVVHHAGAGTTAAGLRAGVPSVAVPVVLDQPFWASRLTALGVSPGSVPMGRLTAEALASAIRQATDDRYRRRARHLSRVIASEDGAGRVLAAVDRLANDTR